MTGSYLRPVPGRCATLTAERPSARRLVAVLAGVLALVGAQGCGASGVAPAAQGDGLLARFKTYPRGSLTASPDGESRAGRRVGCLEVGAERVLDRKAEPHTVTLAFSLGNRCNHEVDVTLGRVLVTERDAAGVTRVLSSHDPAREVRRRTLDGRSQGYEVLEYEAPPEGSLEGSVVCADLTHSVRRRSVSPVAPVCFARSGAEVSHDAVIGHQANLAFGSKWHAPPFYFFTELSAEERTIGLGGSVFSGTGAGGGRYGFDGVPRVSTFGAVDHFNLRVTGPLYVGGMLVVDGGHLGPRAPFVAGPTVGRTGSTVEEIGAGILVGLMSRPMAGIRVRADVALGQSLILVDVDVPGCRNPCGSAEVGRTWLQPRLVMDTWITPWWTASSWIAADALHPPDVAVGLSLGFHVRSFDGFP